MMKTLFRALLFVLCLTLKAFGQATSDTSDPQVAGGSGTPVSVVAPLSASEINSTNVITTSMATGKVIGRSTAGTGVFEVLDLGSGLSISAGTLSYNPTMSTGKLLGRSTAGTGAFEEITVGSNLTLAGGTLSATGGGAVSMTGSKHGSTYHNSNGVATWVDDAPWWRFPDFLPNSKIILTRKTGITWTTNSSALGSSTAYLATNLNTKCFTYWGGETNRDSNVAFVGVGNNTAWKAPIIVSWGTAATNQDIIYKHNGGWGTLFCDGQPVDWIKSYTSTATGYWRINTGTTEKVPHDWTFIGSDGMVFGGINVHSIDWVTPGLFAGGTNCWLEIGDSSFYGTGATNGGMGPVRLSLLMNKNIKHSNLGGTGYSSHGATGNTNYLVRLNIEGASLKAAGYNVPVVFFAGGATDNGLSSATIQGAVSNCFATATNLFPNAVVVCQLPLDNFDSPSYMNTRTNVVFVATNLFPNVVKVIDPLRKPLLNNGNGATLTWTSGPANGHPNQFGHDALLLLLGKDLYEALTEP
jgi:hypothetical protein